MGEIVYFSESQLIENIVKDAYIKSCKGDWSCIDDLQAINIPELFYIYESVFECLINTLKAFQLNEKHVYEWFRTNHKFLLGNDYEIISKKNNSHHIPDFWVTHCNEEIPVECKLDVFNERALTQLKRYMQFYKAKEGIAIAQRCIVKLPKNIKFISFSIDDIKGNNDRLNYEGN